ncbi:MAG: N,N-dimethylformamidase beta subunit family domain-containing protein [Nocardioides sp.]
MTTTGIPAAGLLLALAVLATGCTTAVGDAAPRAPRAVHTTGEHDGPRAAKNEAGPAGNPAPPRGTEDWRLTRPAYDGQIAAYSTAISGLPGEPLELKVSTPADAYRVSVYRIGGYRRGSGHRVARTRWVDGRVQAAPVMRPEATRTVVAPWRVDLRLDTAGWEPGLHVVKLVTGKGWQTLVPYVVSSPSTAGTVALVAPVTTWQAYNQWGGHSLYHGPEGDSRSYAVSFDRPFNLAGGANDYRTAAIPIVRRAERLGIPLSYLTSVDLHTRPGVLDGAHGFVSMGHDEYWTTTMRTAVERARADGTNLAIFGANTMYWRVRLDDTSTGPARRMVGYRDAAYLDPMGDVEPSETTARFRDAPAPDAEHALLGMQYECYPVDTDYVVASPGWWGFAGTGVRLGSRIPGLVGPEADRVYPDGRLPRPLQILSDSPYNCRGVTTRTHSVYFTTRSGAGVFNAGTLRWGCAIVDRCDKPLGRRTAEFVARVTDNVLRRFATGPAGDRWPARDNVDRFGLSAVNTVSAS